MVFPESDSTISVMTQQKRRKVYCIINRYSQYFKHCFLPQSLVCMDCFLSCLTMQWLGNQIYWFVLRLDISLPIWLRWLNVVAVSWYCWRLWLWLFWRVGYWWTASSNFIIKIETLFVLTERECGGFLFMFVLNKFHPWHGLPFVYQTFLFLKKINSIFPLRCVSWIKRIHCYITDFFLFYFLKNIFLNKNHTS